MLLTPARAALLSRLLLVAAAAVAAGAAVVLLVVEDAAARRFLALYTAPVFVALFLWLRVRLRTEHSRAALAVDAAVIVLGLLRLGNPSVPWSGHMLFYGYTALTTRSVPYVAFAVLLAAETTWFKLVLWDDFRSWILGLGLALFLAARRAVVARRPSAMPMPRA